ncbi:hypothetical protein V8G54_018216 [Vigna mungo]|uniref:Uncharacterized protein n=1 Tax=Vigna mungo TaxID=3915 RepID=A0AAQ3N9I9_VIGMU
MHLKIKFSFFFTDIQRTLFFCISHKTISTLHRGCHYKLVQHPCIPHLVVKAFSSFSPTQLCLSSFFKTFSLCGCLTWAVFTVKFPIFYCIKHHCYFKLIGFLTKHGSTNLVSSYTLK